MNDENKNLENFMDIKLSSEQLDVLKELGNIGSGHAITALSNLLNSKVRVELTSVKIIPFWKIPELFDNPNADVFGIFSKIADKENLSIIQIFTKESVINLINRLTEFDKIFIENIESINDLDQLSYSIINEIGNILAAHYSNALADLMSIKIVPDIPKLALDNLTALLNEIIAKYSQLSDYTIIIKTKLSTKKMKLDGIICLIISMNALYDLFNILKIKYDLNF